MRAVVVTRLLSIPISFICNILIARLVLGEYGLATWNTIALIASIPSLLPFIDFGVGAALVNVAVDLDSVDSRDRALRRLGAATRILSGLVFVVLVVAVTLGISGAWYPILGRGVASQQDVAVAASAVLVVLGLNSLNGMAARLLQGAGKNALIAVSLGFVPVLTLGLTYASVALEAPPVLLGCAVSVSGLLATAAIWPRALRVTSLSLRDFAHGTDKEAVRSVLVIGGFSLVVNIALVIGFQLDRFVLSHTSSTEELGYYSLISPLYAAAFSVMTSAASTLWPKYGRMRQSQTMKVSTWRTDVFRFLGLSVLGAACLIGLGPFVIQIMSNGSVAPGLQVFAAFAALLVVQSVHLPAGMFLTDTSGFRVQALLATVMTVVNFGLSVGLAPHFGAVGVLWGSVVAVGLVQAPATAVFAVRRIRREAMETELAVDRMKV